MKEMPGDIVILQMYTKNNDQTIYGSMRYGALQTDGQTDGRKDRKSDI